MGEIDNFLVPNHRKLDMSEINSLLKKYGVESTTKLPQIKVKDSSLKSSDFQIGDVVEVIRNNFAGESKYYRVVVE